MEKKNLFNFTITILYVFIFTYNIYWKTDAGYKKTELGEHEAGYEAQKLTFPKGTQLHCWQVIHNSKCFLFKISSRNLVISVFHLVYPVVKLAGSWT